MHQFCGRIPGDLKESPENIHSRKLPNIGPFRDDVVVASFAVRDDVSTVLRFDRRGICRDRLDRDQVNITLRNCLAAHVKFKVHD